MIFGQTLRVCPEARPVPNFLDHAPADFPGAKHMPDLATNLLLSVAAVSLPALFAGSLLGIVAFRNINEIGCRRTILVLLLLSGASLALA